MKINKITSENPIISVVICAYSSERYDDTIKSIFSILKNNYKNYEIIIIIDGNEDLKQKIKKKFKGINKISILDNKKNEGPSVSRNLGVDFSKGEIVAFIDDDAFAQPNWLDTIKKNFIDHPNIAACGGKLIPIYEKGAKKIPEELLWIVGCTYKGHTQKKKYVRNVISANMAVKKEVFTEIKFEKMFDGINWKMEDTLFGIRLFLKDRNLILYDPKMIIYHKVIINRTKIKYIINRSYSEGILKANLGKYVNCNVHKDRLFHQEKNYFFILIFSIFKYIFFKLRVVDSLLLSISLFFVLLGYLVEFFSLRDIGRKINKYLSS